MPAIMPTFLLDKENTGVVIVDVQDKLMQVMRRKETVIGNIIKVLHLSRLFDLPVILTEQYPKMAWPYPCESKRIFARL